MAKVKVIFMGRKAVAAKALKWLCERDDTEVIGVITDSHLEVSPTTNIAKLYGIPFFSRDELELKILSGEISVDLGFSMLYWQKIYPSIINACRYGIINFHPAPLPDFKGTAGYNIAILKGLTKWAVSAHYVDSTIDTGPIIKIKKFQIDKKFETVKSLESKCQSFLFELFESTADKALKKNNFLPTKPNIGGTYISRVKMEAMKEIRPGDDVSRKIRAFWFPPYDGAFIILGGIKYTLVDSQILKSLNNTEDSNLFTTQKIKK